MTDKIKNTLRIWFGCKRIGHEWVVGSTRGWDRNQIFWDGKTWRCVFCNEIRTTQYWYDRPEIGVAWEQNRAKQINWVR